MFNKKSTSAITAIFSVIFSAFILTACSGNSNDKTPTTDSSTMQAAPMQDTSMQTDTSMMDTASTRPIKNPH